MSLCHVHRHLGIDQLLPVISQLLRQIILSHLYSLPQHPRTGMKQMTSFQVGVAAEAIAAAQFARARCHVSVQYGANQPGYDLIAERNFKTLLISLKGSKDEAWGLTQNHLANADYHGAVGQWLTKHGEKLVFCFVQFKGKALDEMPDIYLATALEVANHMKLSRAGTGDTILHVSKTWISGIAAGHTQTIPRHWKSSQEKVDCLFPDTI